VAQRQANSQKVSDCWTRRIDVRLSDIVCGVYDVVAERGALDSLKESKEPSVDSAKRARKSRRKRSAAAAGRIGESFKDGSDDNEDDNDEDNEASLKSYVIPHSLVLYGLLCNVVMLA
jgi:hypothetical protein